MRKWEIRDGMLFLLAVGLTFACVKAWERWRITKFDSQYQAVQLTNNTVYIGKLEGLGTSFPVLRDVFYIQTLVNPETKQATNTLVRRNATWHSPSFMVLSEKQIVMIEPVGKDSKAAEMLRQDSSSTGK